MKVTSAAAAVVLLSGSMVAADVENAFSLGAVRFRDDFVATEFYYRQSAAREYGPLDIVYGISGTTEGSLWAGVGVTLTAGRQSPVYAKVSFMPGLYSEGNGPDLGYPLEFRSGLEVGYRLESGATLGIGVDHRSNNGYGDTNPGLDTAFVRYTIAR